jgi:hypothetical protein
MTTLTAAAVFQINDPVETTSYASVGPRVNFGCVMTNTLSDSISISYPGSGGKAKYQQTSLSTCGD